MVIHYCYVEKENNTQEEILNTLKQQLNALESSVPQLVLVGYSYSGGHDSKVNGDFINEVHDCTSKYGITSLKLKNFTFTESIKTFEGVLSELNLINCTLAIKNSDENIPDTNTSYFSSISNLEFTNVLNLGFSFKSIAPFSNEDVHTISIHNTFLNSFEGLELFPSVINLHLQDNNISSFAELPVLENLEKLDVSNNNIKDFKDLKVLPKLLTLKVDSNKIYSLKDLPTMPKLKELYVSNNKLKSLTGLKKQPNLSLLDASHNKILKIPASKSFKTLSCLYLNNNFISDIDLSFCDYLDELNVYSNSLALLDLKSIPQIRSLNCSDNRIKKIFNNNTSGVVTKVYNLTAEKNFIYYITDIAVEVIDSLNINRNPIEKLNCLEKHPSIKSLDLENCYYLRSLVGNSETISSIDSLYISNTIKKRISVVTEEDFFGHYTNLVKLYINNSCIIRNLNNIGKLQNLLYLDLINTSIRSIPLEIIKCKSLRKITFAHDYFSLSNEGLNNLLEIIALHRILNSEYHAKEFTINLDISSINFEDVLKLLKMNVYKLLVKNDALDILSISESTLHTFRTLKVKDMIEIKVGNNYIMFNSVTS